MKKLSVQLLTSTVSQRRKERGMTQAELSKRTGINRALISRLESGDFTPSVDQLLALSDVLGFDMQSLLTDPESVRREVEGSYRIAVAGTGYVGLSLAVLLAQHNDVTAVDIIPEKVEKLNRFESPIQDEYIEKYLSEASAGKRRLSLTATTDAVSAYAGADIIIIVNAWSRQ